MGVERERDGAPEMGAALAAAPSRVAAWLEVMELSELLAGLSRPAAYGKPPGTPVEVVQTHISAVFLVGEDVYKLKKPVSLGFVDYSTLERRRRFCELEVTLNRRLAPDVYLGVLPVTRAAHGLALDGPGEPLDFVVHMRRLPDDAQLGARIEAGGVDGSLLAMIGRRIAGFHREGRRGPDVSAWARFDAVAQNCRENFEHIASAGGVPGALRDRAARLTEEALERSRGLVEARASRDVPRDTHGDLRLDHIYLFPEKAPPGDLVIVDCIEFGERFRCSDPASDLAFLRMDLLYAGHPELARALTEGYLDELGRGEPLGEGGGSIDDELSEARALLPLYTAYRAAIRAKVDALRASAPEVPSAARRDALEGAMKHLMLVLGELAPPEERPCLLLVMGLPGTGKSTLAGALAGHGGAWVRSDVVRKELVGLAAETSAAAAPGEGIYTRAWTERTYAECLARARDALLEGRRTVVDANFRAESQRAPFVALARDLGMPLRALVCTTDEERVRERLAARAGDASDADFAVYLAAKDEWEPLGSALDARASAIDTSGTPEEAAARALEVLRAEGLA